MGRITTTAPNRITTKRDAMAYCLASCLPLMAMALVFNISLALPGRYFPGASLSVFGYIMHAEFLAAASGILLILPLLFPAGTRRSRWIRMAIFMVFGYAFAWMSYNVDGTSGMLFYTLLVFLTFGGCMLFIFDWLSYISRAFLSLLRWSVAIFVYVTLQLHFDLGINIEEWKNTPQVIPFGAAFFYTLCAMEVLVYPFLTYYLENNVTQEKRQERMIRVAEGQP